MTSAIEHAAHVEDAPDSARKFYRPFISDIQAVHVFNGLSRSEIDLVASLSTVRVARRGEMIRTQRNAADPVCFVISGRFQLSLCRQFRKRLLLRIAGPGDQFGELHALTGLPLELLAQAEAEARYLEVSGADLLRLLRELPDLSLRLLKTTAGMSLAQIERLFELSALHLRDRVRAEILRLASSVSPQNERLVIRPAPTHEMFASIVGGTREGVTRELRALTKQGIIEVGRRQITVTDVSRLRETLTEALGRPTP